MIAVNLFGAFLVSRAAAQQMVKQGQGGKLIFISSVYEDIPFPGYTAYCAAKGGIRMMMRNLSMELAQYKINVNDVVREPLRRQSIKRCSIIPRRRRRH